MGRHYWIDGLEISKPSNENFQLHVHDNYEIYLFLEGDTKYIIEENVYTLEPGDVIVIRKNLMHRAYHNSAEKYSRIVLNIHPEFFKENGCSEYEKEFIDPPENASHKIDAKTVHSSGLYDAFMRIKKYSDNFENLERPIVRATITEILFLINKVRFSAEPDVENSQLRDVIKYINNGFCNKITLDELEKKFFISKYHLCRIFNQATGLTIHKYITDKRLAYVGELMKEGDNAAQAAVKAGFNNYSSFYRAYMKKYEHGPRNGRKQLEK